MSDAVAKIEPASMPATVQSESAALISMIERAARDPNVDLQKMERLFEMQGKAMAQRSRAAFLASLSDMQADLPAATRGGKGHNDKSYARFEDVIAAVRPNLKAHGFSLTFRLDHTGDRIKVTGVLGHRDGHQEETSLPLPADSTGNKNAVQGWGSAISYGKRYVALTLLGIATEDDDDGKKAGAEPSKPDKVAEITKLIAETDADLAWILDHYSVESLDDLNAKQAEHCKAGLIARKRQKAAKP